MPDAFFAGNDDFLFGIVVPVDWMKVVREVNEVANDSKLPFVLRVWRHEVFKKSKTGPVAIDTASTAQRLHEKLVRVPPALHPVHAVSARFVVQPNRLPQLCPILRRDEVEDGAIFQTFAIVPLPTDSDLALAIPVDVPRRDADVVSNGQVFRDDVLRPARILVPLKRLFVCQNDVRLSVAVDIGQLHSVTD